jgi:hypothetical protein
VAHDWQAETPSPEPPNLVGAPRVVLAADRLRDAQVETLPEKNLRLMKTEVAPRVVSALQGLARKGRITLNEADTYAAGSWIVAVFDIDWGTLGWKSRLRYRFDVFSRLTMVWWDDWGKNQWRDIEPTKPIILMIDWPVHRKLEFPVPALQQATPQLRALPRTTGVCAPPRPRPGKPTPWPLSAAISSTPWTPTPSATDRSKARPPGASAGCCRSETRWSALQSHVSTQH